MSGFALDVELMARAVVEVAGLRADLFGSLPVSACLTCRAVGFDGVWAVTSSARRYAAHKAQGVVVFDPTEWLAIVSAAENDRASAPTLLGWLAHKQAVTHWILKTGEALGGLVDVVEPQGWSIERVLRAYGAELVRVSL